MKKSIVISALLYYGGWLGAVLGAAEGQPDLGTGIILAVVLFGVLKGGRTELCFAGVALLIGFAFESSLVWLKLVDYPQFAVGAIGLKPPIWMILLWPLLMRTLAKDQCLAWTKGRRLLGIAFGGVGGGLAYFAGHQLGALQFQSDVDPAITAVKIGICWAILYPLIAETRSYMEKQLFMGKREGNDFEN